MNILFKVHIAVINRSFYPMPNDNILLQRLDNIKNR